MNNTFITGITGQDGFYLVKIIGKKADKAYKKGTPLTFLVNL